MPGTTRAEQPSPERRTLASWDTSTAPRKARTRSDWKRGLQCTLRSWAPTDPGGHVTRAANGTSKRAPSTCSSPHAPGSKRASTRTRPATRGRTCSARENRRSSLATNSMSGAWVRYTARPLTRVSITSNPQSPDQPSGSGGSHRRRLHSSRALTARRRTTGTRSTARRPASPRASMFPSPETRASMSSTLSSRAVTTISPAFRDTTLSPSADSVPAPLTSTSPSSYSGRPRKRRDATGKHAGKARGSERCKGSSRSVRGSVSAGTSSSG